MPETEMLEHNYEQRNPRDDAERSLIAHTSQLALSKESLDQRDNSFLTAELESIYIAWNQIDPEVRELTTVAFPEIAAYLVAKKLEKIRIDRELREKQQKIRIRTNLG